MSGWDSVAEARDELVAALQSWNIDEDRPVLSPKVRDALYVLDEKTNGSLARWGIGQAEARLFKLEVQVRGLLSEREELAVSR